MKYLDLINVKIRPYKCKLKLSCIHEVLRLHINLYIFVVRSRHYIYIFTDTFYKFAVNRPYIFTAKSYIFVVRPKIFTTTSYIFVLRFYIF